LVNKKCVWKSEFFGREMEKWFFFPKPFPIFIYNQTILKKKKKKKKTTKAHVTHRLETSKVSMLPPTLCKERPQHPKALPGKPIKRPSLSLNVYTHNHSPPSSPLHSALHRERERERDSLDHRCSFTEWVSILLILLSPFPNLPLIVFFFADFACVMVFNSLDNRCSWRNLAPNFWWMIFEIAQF